MQNFYGYTDIHERHFYGYIDTCKNNKKII